MSHMLRHGTSVFKVISVGIPMGTNCVPLLAKLFLYSYEAEFVKTKCYGIKTTKKLPCPSTLHMGI